MHVRVLGEGVICTCTYIEIDRWCSTHLMLGRLLRVREPLERVLAKNKEDSLRESQWRMMGELDAVLKPFSGNIVSARNAEIFH